MMSLFVIDHNLLRSIGLFKNRTFSRLTTLTKVLYFYKFFFKILNCLLKHFFNLTQECPTKQTRKKIEKHNKNKSQAKKAGEAVEKLQNNKKKDEYSDKKKKAKIN